MQRLTAIVHGRVQGVYFRDYTRRQANQLHLTGWVANQYDDTVKVVAEGAEAALAKLLEWLQQGPPLANVEWVDVTWGIASEEFSSFDVWR
jgi:acylphosphatase